MITLLAYVEGANTLQFTIRKYMKASIIEKTEFIAVLLWEKGFQNSIITSMLTGWKVVMVNLVLPPLESELTITSLTNIRNCYYGHGPNTVRAHYIS
jgi:hypothetical protein